jgi:hypothetical protein
MQPKFASFAQALVVAAGLALAPVAAFAQTAPAAPATVQPKVAKPAETKPATTPQQTAEAACAVHKKDSKEFKDCVDKSKAAAPAKDPAKKS